MAGYPLQLGPLKRELSLVKLPNGVKIASFVLLGDAELTHYAAQQLVNQLTTTAFDYLVTFESKGVPLTQEMADLCEQPQFVVLRKTVKDYMTTPLTVPVSAITTSTPQQLVLNGSDAELLRNKRVVLVDDVISSGGSLAAAEQLLNQVGAIVVRRLAVLAEGKAVERNDIDFLGALPVFI